MILIELTEVSGFEAAIRGMRNPMNSWEKSDSEWVGGGTLSEYCVEDDGQFGFLVGGNDRDLMMRLAKAGTEHAKYLRMITVTTDVIAPLYWWKEFDTYKVGTVANSCSTMHKLHSNELSFDDFSFEHLGLGSIGVLQMTIDHLNKCRRNFVESGDKDDWWQLIQLLPSSYNQKRTVMFNYQVLANIYRQRKNHKLDEWREFCNWIKTLPCSELITLEES